MLGQQKNMESIPIKRSSKLLLGMFNGFLIKRYLNSYFKRRIPTQIIRVRERVRREFWEKGHGNQADSVYADVSSRLFVVFNSKIFGFPKYSE